MPSRDTNDLTPEVRALWFQSLEDWNKQYADSEWEPFITCTFRSNEEQDALYAIGRTRGALGKKVTNARAGQSIHNRYPSPAFDICFRKRTDHNQLSWEVKYYRLFATIAIKNGLAWGGNWVTFKDNAHFVDKDINK